GNAVQVGCPQPEFAAAGSQVDVFDGEVRFRREAVGEAAGAVTEQLLEGGGIAAGNQLPGPVRKRTDRGLQVLDARVVVAAFGVIAGDVVVLQVRQERDARLEAGEAGGGLVDFRNELRSPAVPHVPADQRQVRADLHARVV